MKTLAVVIGLLLVTWPVEGQQRSFKINAKMGVISPAEFSASNTFYGFQTDRVKNQFQPGVGAELSFGYLIRPQIEVGLGMASYRALAKNTAGSLRQLVFMGFGTYYFTEGNFKPYARAGAGLTKLGFDFQTQFNNLDNVSATVPSLNLGGGAEINLSDDTVINFSGGMNYVFTKNKEIPGSGSSFRAAWLDNAASSSENAYRFDKNMVGFYFTAGLMFGLRI